VLNGTLLALMLLHFPVNYRNHWRPANVTIIQLPPYSPELNPIENLWHYLKSHFWSNRAYADYDELEQAAVHAWKQAVLDADLMKTVCNAPYAQRATSG
jgi:putative transposase